MKTWYCIENIYRGFFTKKYVGTSHMILIPVSNERCAFFSYYGTFRDKGVRDRRVWALYGHAPNEYMKQILQSTIDKFPNFKIIEGLICTLNNTKHKEFPLVTISTKGKYIKTDLELEYNETLSNYLRNHCYFINGDIKFIDKPVEGQGKPFAGKLGVKLLGQIFGSFKEIKVNDKI